MRSRRGSLAVLCLVPSLLLGACEEPEIEQPEPLFDEVPIQYPLELWDREVEGTTVLRVRVDTVGTVDSLEVAESSGHDAFDSAAVRGGRQLRFRPARSDGEVVRVWARVPVHFSREAEAAPPGADPPEADSPGADP